MPGLTLWRRLVQEAESGPGLLGGSRAAISELGLMSLDAFWKLQQPEGLLR